MKRVLLICMLSTVLALSASFSQHTEGWQYLKIRFAGEGQKRKQVEDALRLFNTTYAGFYDSGGFTEGLDAFPASNLVKRRIFQDIQAWNQQGKWLIHDLHKLDIVRIDFISHVDAVVIARELWDMWVRLVATGEKEGRRTEAIQVRYYMRYEGGRWIVWEYETYRPDEQIPPLTRLKP